MGDSRRGAVCGSVFPPVELAAVKAMSYRTRAWADIEAMLGARTLDLDELRRVLAEMLDAEDPRFSRLEEAVRRSGTDVPR